MKHRIALASVALVAVVSVALIWPRALEPLPSPETVRIAAGLLDYRPAGQYRQGTRIVDAPMRTQDAALLEIMKFHVSEAEYVRCVDEAACPATLTTGRTDLAQTHINHADATAYADWLSSRPGEHWRLPTDAEWMRAAAERGNDDGFSAEANGDDPSRRWIASYRREVALRGEADLTGHPLGYFGLNTSGLADMAGNVWERTETCFQNGMLTADGSAVATGSDYCGVRAVQGKHRAFVIDFIRDARVGGCAAGVPPDYLVFRLVRDGAD